MDILKLLEKNFKNGGCLVTVFDHENTDPENKEYKLLRTFRFIRKELGPEVKFIWFKEKDAPDFVCGSIFVSERLDIILMAKRQIEAGYIEIPEKNFPLLADYIKRKAEGKFGMSANCLGVTKSLWSRCRNIIRRLIYATR